MCDHLDKPGGTLDTASSMLGQPSSTLDELGGTKSHAIELVSMVAAFGNQNASTPPHRTPSGLARWFLGLGT